MVMGWSNHQPHSSSPRCWMMAGHQAEITMEMNLRLWPCVVIIIIIMNGYLVAFVSFIKWIPPDVPTNRPSTTESWIVQLCIVKDALISEWRQISQRSFYYFKALPTTEIAFTQRIYSRNRERNHLDHHLQIFSALWVANRRVFSVIFHKFIRRSLPHSSVPAGYFKLLRKTGDTVSGHGQQISLSNLYDIRMGINHNNSINRHLLLSRTERNKPD